MVEMLRKKKGQVWIETVIYTLIGIAIVGIVLATVKPKIDAKQDEILIGQAIEALNVLDSKIYEVQKATGNKRMIDLEINKGRLIIDKEGNKIKWVISDSEFQYSEKDTPISVGKMTVLTEQGGPWKVTITLDYSSIVDIQYGNDNTNPETEFSAVSAAYNLIVENKGMTSGASVIPVVSIYEV